MTEAPEDLDRGAYWACREGVHTLAHVTDRYCVCGLRDAEWAGAAAFDQKSLDPRPSG